MQVHTTDRHHVAFFLSHEELSTYGLDESQVDGVWTRQITLRLLRDIGVSVDGVLEIEAFPGQSGLMVFASLSPESALETAYYLFDSFDHVTACCALLRAPPRQSLLAIHKGQYLLAVSDIAAISARIGHVASEFGRPLYLPHAFVRFLREQKAVVIPEQAVQRLAALH